ncbi:MerR family transcriptional regulator [Xylanimonas ulmi]|uniref:DNA-binding transcriptional MerR regulator n=1 Tax=Xylanimonas ulmi TaxID=228973 RepID=A0A4Q7M586_9MICO|nr:MerR family transcriptional regulator [Xylanibacterium ulmi]RZS62581.1 DNA-binding transcriptional MerR regulator [Xylanibacterium ulmi]
MSGPHDDVLSIGELSRRTRASVRSIRHYEQSGLLDAARTSTGHRRFTADDVETVRRIRLLLDGGLSLAVIAKVLPCFADEGATLDACVAEYLRDHLHTVQERIAHLDRQRESITRLQQLVSA